MNSLARGVDKNIYIYIFKLPVLEHSSQTVMHRTKKSRFDAGVKCTVNDLTDAPSQALSQVNASCSLYYRRPYESCTKMLGNSKSD